MSSGTLSGESHNASNDVDCFIVTEVAQDTFLFRWNIRGFKLCLKDKDPDRELISPVFHVLHGKSKSEWQLKIKWSKKVKRSESRNEEDEYLSVFLHLVDCTTITKAVLQIEIFDSEKCWFKMEGEQVRIFNKNGEGWGWGRFVKIQELLNPVNNVLEDDTLKLKCHIIMERDAAHDVRCSQVVPHEKSCKRKHADIDTCTSDFMGLYNSPDFSDVSIQTKTSVWKAHKLILSCRSPVFSAMFRTEMSESINNIVHISDFDEDIVEIMLTYIYGGELDQELLGKKSMDVFRIADKYDIKELKDVSEEIISKNLSVENASECLVFADMNSVSKLKKSAIKFFNVNTAEIKKTKGYRKLLNYNTSIFKELYQEL